MKKEQIKIDLIIDLHGFNLDDAFDSLKKNLSICVIKTVLLITGKSGIMRDLVPRWIKYNKNVFYRISEIKNAPNNLGGSGAFIIKLKNY